MVTIFLATLMPIFLNHSYDAQYCLALEIIWNEEFGMGEI